MFLTQVSAPQTILKDEIGRLIACIYPGVNLAIPGDYSSSTLDEG
ncbi:Hypothetical protein Minf_1910 [Methylacidiphilum infernorum V4]|uniref:Uncharacterized protein n=1 Tax=Methylacidiphilum infernorum (isolate V4) TaxID=481448 RepID=B3DY12_METI4|nr:Hypothetical protein Minf_1910 [Methylacidiphilum infernorum V4]